MSHRQQLTKALPAAILALSAGACTPSGADHTAAAMAQEPAKPTFTASGELNRPEGYREWVYVGTPITPNDLNPPEAAFPEFHNVYIHPSDYAHLRQTGEFPDGTVIVKELVSVQATSAVSGNGYFMGDFIGLEATIKSAGRFPDEPNNWAYFSFGHVPEAEYAATAGPFPTESCAACHQARAANDMVFTQYYPVLRAALRSSSVAMGEAP